jgi:hypothetical protein
MKNLLIERNKLQHLAGILKEDAGMAAMSSSQQHPGYPELDPIVGDISLAVRNTVLKLLKTHGVGDNDAEMPFKAQYVLDGVMRDLKSDPALMEGMFGFGKPKPVESNVQKLNRALEKVRAMPDEYISLKKSLLNILNLPADETKLSGHMDDVEMVLRADHSPKGLASLMKGIPKPDSRLPR